MHPTVCQIEDSGFHTDDLTLEEALESLEYNPFAKLQIWNGNTWETVFDGIEEFSGVQPDNGYIWRL